MADFSAGPNYLQQGTAYLGPSIYETLVPVETWKIDSVSLQETDVKGKLYATGMTITTDRPFDSDSTSLIIDNNEDYLLCVDSWIYNAKEVVRSQRGCGKFSIEMPTDAGNGGDGSDGDTGGADKTPDNGNNGDNGNEGDKDNGSKIDGEVDGDKGETPDKENLDNVDETKETGASTLALSTAVLALSVLAF